MEFMYFNNFIWYTAIYLFSALFVYFVFRDNIFLRKCLSIILVVFISTVGLDVFLQNNTDILLSQANLEGASPLLKNNKEFVIEIVKKNAWKLKYASPELRNDHEVVMAAVKQDWYVLKYASKELRSDHDIVMAAVKQDGMALEYASEALQNDREIVMAAVQQNGIALCFVSNTIRNDDEVVKTAINENEEAIKCAGLKFTNPELWKQLYGE